MISTGSSEPEIFAEAPPSSSSLEGFLSTMGVRLSSERRVLEVDGWVNMQDGVIEVVACSPGGKEHESLLVLDCVPSGVHAGLLALGLEPDPLAFERTPPTLQTQNPTESSSPAAVRGDGVLLRVRWSTEAGEEQETPVENWILDLRSGASMPMTPWLFTGSVQTERAQGVSSSRYAADQVGSIVTTYRDRSTVLDNPLPGGTDDTVYSVHSQRVPPVGTKIVAVFFPVSRSWEGEWEMEH